MSDVQTVIEDQVLHGTGKRAAQDWAAFAAGLPDATAVWADLEGMHRVRLPGTLPQATTHLWFWTAGCQGRVRIDGVFWVAGVLSAKDATLPSPCRPVQDGLVVDVTLHRPYDENWGPVKQRRGDAAAWEPLAQLVPRRANTAVFLTSPDLVGLHARGV
ncbi:MAG: hypothetical protein ACRDS0_03615 [Pseudonocardiaceae bacterium]